VEELAFVVQALTARRLANDVDVFAHPRQRLCKPLAVQVLDDELATGTQTEKETPLGHAIEVERGHRDVRGRPGEYGHDAGADADP